MANKHTSRQICFDINKLKSQHIAERFSLYLVNRFNGLQHEPLVDESVNDIWHFFKTLVTESATTTIG